MTNIILFKLMYLLSVNASLFITFLNIFQVLFEKTKEYYLTLLYT